MYRIYYTLFDQDGLTLIIEADTQKEAKSKFYRQGAWTKDAFITDFVDLLRDQDEKGRFYTYKELDALKQECYNDGYEDAQDEFYHRRLEESTL